MTTLAGPEICAVLSPLMRRLRYLVLGRRFMRSLEANRAAAENLDRALREMLDH